jgi:hypothetical protein
MHAAVMHLKMCGGFHHAPPRDAGIRRDDVFIAHFFFI